MTPAGAVRARRGRARHPARGPAPGLPDPAVAPEAGGTSCASRPCPRSSAPPELQAEAAFAAEYLRPHFAKARGEGGRAARCGSRRARSRARTRPRPTSSSSIPAEGIRIRGNSPAGVFYGLQSLRGLLPAVADPAKGLALPALTVVDAPRFGYRGFMLDVARNFQPKASVLRVLDLMARYKLNVFHFHLTDDEGWRVEIPSLPELTAVGARRGHTLDSSRFLPPAYGSGPDVDRPYGSGFYSRADYERDPEVRRGAAHRGDPRAGDAGPRPRRDQGDGGPLPGAPRRPGDAEGARRYLLSDPEDRSEYTSAQLYHDNVMNPALPSTYAFVERVVQDLVALHREAGVPLRNLHMGGDEVPAASGSGRPPRRRS